MPAPEHWESFFDAAGIVETLAGREVTGDVVEFGCGYGTFTIPIGKRTQGTVFAIDIEASMVEATIERCSASGLKNVVVERRDFVATGSGRASLSIDCALLFNILHIEEPVLLLEEAHRVLRPGGIVAVIHWNYDARTPRGPPLEIRPRPQQCRAWGKEAGLRWVRDAVLPGAPWHWGSMFERPLQSLFQFLAS